MGKRVINMIFEPAIGGHLLEYIHNIYIYATKSEHHFIFVLSNDFNDVKDNLISKNDYNGSVKIIDDMLNISNDNLNRYLIILLELLMVL